MRKNEIKQEDLYNKSRDDCNCFPLVKASIENLIVIDKEIFDKKKGDYGYYMEGMFGEITPFCVCGSDEIIKIKNYLYFLNKGCTQEELDYIEENTSDLLDLYNKMGNKKIQEILNKQRITVYNNELLYSFMDKEGLFEHGTSIGSCWLTEKGNFVKNFLLIYLSYIT